MCLCGTGKHSRVKSVSPQANFTTTYLMLAGSFLYPYNIYIKTLHRRRLQRRDSIQTKVDWCYHWLFVYMCVCIVDRVPLSPGSYAARSIVSIDSTFDMVCGCGGLRRDKWVARSIISIIFCSLSHQAEATAEPPCFPSFIQPHISRLSRFLLGKVGLLWAPLSIFDY